MPRVPIDVLARRLATLPQRDLDTRIQIISEAVLNFSNPTFLSRERRLREKVTKLERQIEVLTGYHEDGSCIGHRH